MFRNLCVLISILLAFTSLARTPNQEQGKQIQLKVGIYDFEPHMIAKEADYVSPKGALIDYLSELQKSSKINFKLQTMNFARVMKELEVSNIDLVAMIAKTPEREKIYQYSEEPIFTTRSAVIFSKKNSINKINAISDLRGLKLGHLTGSVVPTYLRENGVVIEAISGENYFIRNIKRVKENRINGIYIPTMSSGEYQLKVHNLYKDFKILEVPNDPLKLYVVFNKNISAGVIKIVNEHMKKIKYSDYLKLQLQK